MLATLVNKPFDEPGWLYEVKWDGYRAVAYCNMGKVNILSRNNKPFNEKFYPVYDALLAWGNNAVVDGEDKNFLVPEDAAALLYMANLGAIEMNPWNSTIHNPDYPDWCMIDLDPDKGNTFEQVIEMAQTVKVVLDELKIKSYPKTSGSTGIHIYIPLGAKYTYEECQLFGKIIATEVHKRLPKFTCIDRMTRNRKGKLYIDYLQNQPKATLAAPYSLRPKPGATVSMPLHWEEVKKGLQMKNFNIKNAIGRIKSEGDILKGVLGRGISLKKLI